MDYGLDHQEHERAVREEQLGLERRQQKERNVRRQRLVSNRHKVTKYKKQKIFGNRFADQVGKSSLKQIISVFLVMLLYPLGVE
jgi:hypothetical protein